jgi:FAD synthetase
MLIMTWLACFDRTEAISLSFNGGKDCTVLLHLVVAVLSRLGRKKDEWLRTVFVTYPNPFPHVDAFVQVCTQRYHLDCVLIPGPMRQALQHYLDTSLPRPKAIFVGIRRNDPYAGKEQKKRGRIWLTLTLKSWLNLY